MTNFLVILHVIVSLMLMLVVLIQQGKGADLAGAFGGGGSDRITACIVCCLMFAWLAPVTAAGQDLTPIKLPAPVMEGGKPLMDVLRQRQSVREYSADKLPHETVAGLLWAAWGINRPDGRRTAPSASNRKEIEIYVTLQEGAFVWDAKTNMSAGLATVVRASVPKADLAKALKLRDTQVIVLAQTVGYPKK